MGGSIEDDKDMEVDSKDYRHMDREDNSGVCSHSDVFSYEADYAFYVVDYIYDGILDVYDYTCHMLYLQRYSSD